MIRLGTKADLAAATSACCRASLSNAADRDNLMAHPEYLILGREGLAEGRTYVPAEDGAVVGFASWAETDGTTELEDLFVDPGYIRRGIATALDLESYDYRIMNRGRGTAEIITVVGKSSPGRSPGTVPLSARSECALCR